MPTARQVVIKNGQIRFIYDAKLDPLLALGTPDVKRASHVEPVVIDGRVKWTSDMSPVGGGLLGPFNTKPEALEAEVDWLNQNNMGL